MIKIQKKQKTNHLFSWNFLITNVFTYEIQK